MKDQKPGRRKFIFNSLLATGGIILASNFISCADDDFGGRDIPGDLSESNFDHGVASFDPTPSQVIIWSRYSTGLPSAEILRQISTEKGTLTRRMDIRLPKCMFQDSPKTQA